MDGLGALGAALSPTKSAILPDTGPSEAPIVTPLPPLEGIDAGTSAADAAANTAAVGATGEARSFSDTLKGYLNDVSDKLTTSDHNIRDLAAGKTNDVQSVVQSVEEANLAFQFTMAMRTKLLTAYQEVSRMQV